MNQYELQRYISVYKQNPYIFGDDFVDEIEKSSKEFDIPFQRNIEAEGDKQDSLVNQFLSGVSSGFTTLGWAEEPTSSAGQIAHSMGHLIGFAPAILSGPLGFAAKSTGVKAFGTAAKFLNRKSVPFYLAEKINKPIYKGLTKAGVNVDEYLKKGNVIADIATSAQELGVASAISSVWGGTDEVMDSYVHGAIFGGAFGSIGNFVNMGKMMNSANPAVRKGAEDFIWNKVVRAGLGSAVQGGMATAQGAPTSVQLYEYLLGGFFGYKHPNAKVKSGRQYIDSFYNKENHLYGDKLFGKEREMVYTEEYKNLDPIAQEYVTNHFQKSIGERFKYYNPQLELFKEDDASVASVLMKAEYLNHFKEENFAKRRNELLEERKKDKLSEEEETLAKIRTLDDIDAEHQRLQIGNIAAEITDKINGSKVKISNASDVVYNKLTKEQREEIKKGNVNIIYEVISGEQDRTMDLKEARDILNLDRPKSDQLEIDAPVHIRNMLTEIESNLKVDKPQLDILNDIIGIYNQSRKNRESFKEFFSQIEVSYPEYVATNKTKRELKSFFNRVSEEKLHGQISYDPVGNKIVQIRTHDLSGRRVADNKPPAPDEIHLKNKDLEDPLKPPKKPTKKRSSDDIEQEWLNWISTSQYSPDAGKDIIRKDIKGFDEVRSKIEYANAKNITYDEATNTFIDSKPGTSQKKGKKPSQKTLPPNYQIQELKTVKWGDKILNLYDKIYDRVQKKFTRVMNRKRWWNLTQKTNEVNEYYKIPKKDKGVERKFPYHPKAIESKNVGGKRAWTVNLVEWEKMISELMKIDPRTREFIQADFKEWNKEFGAGSNAKTKTLKKAYDIYQKALLSNYLYEPFAQFKNAQDRVKRETLIAATGVSQKIIDKYPNFEMVIVDDIPSGQHKTNSKGIEHEFFYTTKDGKTLSKKRLYESEIDGYGVLPTELYNEILSANGFDPTTSRIKPTIAAWVNGQLFLFKGGFHPSKAEYDVALKKPNRAIVMLSAAKAMPKGTQIYHGLASKNPDGSVKYEFKKRGTNKTVKNPRAIKIRMEDLRIDYGVREDSHSIETQTIKKQFHVLLNSLQVSREGFDSLMNEAFAPNIEGKTEANRVVRSLSENPENPIPDNFRIKDIGDKEFVYLVNNPGHPLFRKLLMEMIKKTKFREVSDTFGEENSLIELNDYVNRLQKWANYSDFNPIITMIEPELYQDMILRYRKNKYLYPEWKYSGAMWGAGVDPVTKIKHGAIKKGTFKLGEDADIPVSWGKNETLKSLWKKYQSNLEKLKDPKLKKDKKKLEALKTQTETIKNDLLDIAVMRVPSPAVSGTRMLTFDGFVKNNGKNKDYGAYLNPEDHYYLDGMDVDGDKVFIYQGLPEKFRDTIRKNKDELSVDINGKKATWENKAPDLNKDFGTREAPDFMKSRVSQYLPFALRKSGIASYDGKQGMGAVVNAKTVLNFMTADIIENGGKITLDLISSKGKKYGTVTLVTDEATLNGVKGLRRMAVEASSRTADSSEYWEMMDALEMRDVLLKSAFRIIHAKDLKGNKIDFKYNDIKNTQYGDLSDVNNKLYGRDWRRDKAWGIEEVQRSVENASSKEYKMNSILWLANKMAGSSIDVRYIKGNKAWRELVKAYNEVWKSPEIRQYFARKKFKITPLYLETDYVELEKRVMNLIDSEESKMRTIDSISGNNLRAMGLRRDKNLDPRYQQLFDQAWKDGVIKAHSPLKEAKLLINDAIDLYSAIVLGKKGSEIRDLIIQSGGTEKQALDFLGKLAEFAVIPKVQYRNRIQKIKKSHDPMKFATDDVDKKIADFQRQISEEAKKLNIDRQKALDYFHFYMIGSIYPQPYSSQHSLKLYRDAIAKEKNKPTEGPDKTKLRDDNFIAWAESVEQNWSKYYNKTSFTRFPLESKQVPEGIKKEFMSGFGKMWDVIQSDQPLNKINEFSGEALYPETVKSNQSGSRTRKQIETKVVLERFFDNVFKGKKIEELPKDVIPKDIPQVLKDLMTDLKSMPEPFSVRIEELFAGYTLEAFGKSKKVSDATWDDIRNFQRFIRRAKVSASNSPRVKKLYYYLFPERVGEKQLKYDVSQVYKRTVPYEHKPGDIAFIDIRLPFSTMQYLSESFNQIYNFENIDKEYNQEYTQRFYGWRDQILGMENGTTEFSQLHRAAIAKMLAERESVGKQGSKESKRARREFYNELWEENKPFYESLKDKIYKITEGGKLVEKTGAEVMEWIVTKHQDFFNGFYQKWIRALDREGNSIWDRVDTQNKYGIIDELVEFNSFGRMNLEKIRKKLLQPASFGKGSIIERLINSSSLSVDLLNRIQYEIILENRVKQKGYKPNSVQAKKFRERVRKPLLSNGEYNPQSYTSIGYVDEFYWPQMDHMSTKQSRAKVREYINNQIGFLRSEVGRYADDLLNGVVESTDKYRIKKQFIAQNKQSVVELLEGNLSKEEFINRFVALQELGFERSFNSSTLEDGGAGEFAYKWLASKKNSRSSLDDIGFNSRPGSGRERGESPMPAFSLEFDVVENYSSQWISSFYKNLTALVSHDAINRFSQKNVLYKKEDREDWEIMMKLYTRNAMGQSSIFSPDVIGLGKDSLKRTQDFVANTEKILKKEEISSEHRKQYEDAKEILKKDKRLKKIRKTAYFWTSDQQWAKLLNKLVSNRVGEKLFPDIPKSPEARQRYLIDAVKNIGAFEAKWSLISLLSHPKTAVGNLLGGNVNTISNNGLRHFLRTKDKPFLYNIFKGGKLKDGTEITPDNVSTWLNRFAEESGALESFIVSEASLERGFRGKKVNNFLSEFIEEVRKDYSMPDQSLYDIAKKHGINKAFVDGGAWFMRKSERILRRDSFLSHYLANYEILKDIVPNLKYDNPYLIRMATEGVKATQFLYHASARPAFSATSTGKILTRFMPFAWNSIRFRRLAFQRAATYGFDMNTLPGRRLQRILTLDMLTFALANIFTSSIFDSALPPPMSYLQDTADWVFGDEKMRERAFFNQWPHPALAPLSTITGPSLRLVLAPTKALINNDWEPFLNYQAWTLAPFGRFARSLYRTAEVPEMWVEELTGFPIHRLAQKMKKARKETEEELTEVEI